MNNPVTDKDKMKYPDHPNAYELRILDDEDDNYKAEMSFPALANSNNINFESIVYFNLKKQCFKQVLLEIPNFVLP